MAETNEITPGERRELRSVVKQQFTVLRAEIKQREEELKTDIARQVVEHYSDSDYQLGQATSEVHRIMQDAFRAIDEALEKYPAVVGGRGPLNYHMPRVGLKQDHRLAVTTYAEQELKARVSAARLQLNRQEADLLRELSIGALGTEHARKFLASIPSVSELVPAARIAALESQF